MFDQQYSQMENAQLVDEFYRLWKESGVAKSNIGKYMRNHHFDLYAQIEQRTMKLNQYANLNAKNKKYRYISIFERLYCLEHNLDDRPLCMTCGRKRVAGFFAPKNKYGEYCSSYCQRRSPLCVQHGIQTKKKKYGEDDYLCWKKAHSTRIAKYGSHHPKDYAQKVKATKLKNHGNENYVNTQKMHSTIRRLKVENPNYYNDIAQKIKQTNIANGHDPNWNNRTQFTMTCQSFSTTKKKSIVDKRKQTCLALYGYEFAQQSDVIKEQTKQTNLQKYGVENALMLSASKEACALSARKKSWELFAQTQSMYGALPLISEQEFKNVKDFNLKRDLITWKCKKCGHVFQHVWSGWKLKCPRCFPINYRGMQEEISSFVKSICPDSTIRYDCKSILKDARQLDIYIEDMKIAIEVNGCFWHNADKAAYGKCIPMMYHYNKSIECQKKGIRLIHIFEDEWLYRQKLCRSKLKKIICPSALKHIDWTQCQIGHAINSIEKQMFLEKYTLYGNDGSSGHFYLKYNGHIVAMLTYARMRNCAHQSHWQILNYAEVNSFIVDGGFGILFNTFKDNVHPSLVSMHALLDWETKDSFSKWLDFKRLDKPRLYWTHCTHRFKSTSINKSNARDVLQDYDAQKSFLQNMNDNGYYRIYDSGTLVFQKHFS